jgi:hypothetical protein
MTTEELIKALTADCQAEPTMSRRLQISLLASAALVALLFFTKIGFREDIGSALRTVRFLFKFVVVVPLVAFAIGAMFQSASPVSTLGGWGRLLWLPPFLLAAGVLVELVAVPSSQWMTKAIGSNSVNCMTIIPALGIGPLIIMILAIRHGAPASAGLSGALAGLAASGIAATFYATNCFDDSPLFVVTWYPLATSVLVSIGYVAGLRYLRWQGQVLFWPKEIVRNEFWGDRSAV